MKRLGIACLSILMLLASGCSQQHAEPIAPQSNTPAQSNSPAQSSAAALGHIHAMGVNPADDTLYAGTHYGVYRFPADQNPERVGKVVQDFMGFTVIGPDHFLGSGHPSAQDTDQPGSLGLIESTDGARSWKPLSLSGEADFHALVYRHDRVYGQDSHSGAVMISTDMRTWQRRAVLSAIDLAVSPHDRTDILATTAEGLQRSRDDATTFTPLAASPPLVFVSWPDQGPLVGVDAAGTVYTSDDPDTGWQARQSLASRPQALFAVGDGVVFVATEQAIERSDDHGVSFSPYRILQ
ncbi:MAG: glycoside hydrolase [Actinomycetia bacterium]|nr:glycoside hydrolase [Actinomycetes bacterium]